MEKSRGLFISKIGIVLATAGSAVGLGNIWRFPYETGQNGGAAFIFIYLICILLLGIPAMLCELLIGRNAKANATRAYGKGTWRLVGYMGVFTGFIIMGFYCVVAGWTMQYVYAAIIGQLQGDTSYFQQYFSEFSTHPFRPVLWLILFMLLTHFVIINGVQKGIERASKILMPILFLLLILLVGCSLSLPNAWKGVEFLLKPDFSSVTGETFLDAIGQTFFTLSTGMAALCTYASYFGNDVNLTKSAFQVAAIDTLVAILSGLVIFPAAFSVGVSPDAGPSLIFITLPNVFEQAFSAVPGVGYVVSILFFLLLALAALTSVISMHETPTAFVAEEFHIERKNTAWIVTILAIITGILCSLSLGAVPSLQVIGKSLFDFFDFLSASILLTLGGLLTCVYVGWVMPRQQVYDQMTNWGTLSNRFYSLFILAARYICPLGILMIFLHQFGWI